jgi:hypothetical protein
MDREYVNVLSYNSTQLLALLNSSEHYVNSSNTFAFIGGKNTNIISCPFSYNECLMSNYIAFQNPSYSNKWFFAFITNVIYKSDGMTQIEFEIDAWSTWFENWIKKPCYVLREHVNDDTIGLHTIKENLDIGDVVEEDVDYLMDYGQDGNDYYLCINTTYDPSLDKDFTGVVKINGNFQGNYIFCFDIFTGSVGITNISAFIEKTVKKSSPESIKEMYLLPKVLVDAFGTETRTFEGTVPLSQFTCKILDSGQFYNSTIDFPLILANNFTKTYSFSDYTPKNNKCFVYPYNYLFATNNIGNQNIYKYEDFTQDNPIFDIELAICVGGSGRLVPREYKKIDHNYDESIPLAKFPTCSWAGDAFVNWLSQNAVNITSQIVSTGISIAEGNATSIASNIAGLIGNFYSASLLPSITGGQNTGDVNFSARQNIFTLHHMRVKTENMRIIDDYFSRFGYQINRVKEANITGRQNFNYVEIGSSEEIGNGEVPTNFMDTINNACRKGVTIWHNHENLGNFNVSNNIV